MVTWQDVFQATKRNDFEAVKDYFEKKQGTVNCNDFGGRSIALVAAEYGRLPILKYVLEKNITLLKVPDQAGNTVFERAIQKGDLEMVKYLVEDQKVDILAAEHHANTAVHIAAHEGQLEILKYFVEEKKADVNVRNENGETPLFSAAEKPYLYVIMYLIEERKADPTVTDLTQDNLLFKSAQHNDVTLPKYLLDAKKIPLDVNWRNTKGYTAVNLACRFNHTEFVKYMVEQKKADINIADTKKGRTPLHHAAAKNNGPLCQFLIKHGANLAAKDTFDYVASQLATDPEVAKQLNVSVSRRRRDLGLTDIDESIISHHPISSARKMVAGNSYRSANLLADDKSTGVGNFIGGTSVGALNGFLMVVDTIVRYGFKSSTYQQETRRFMFSPRELLQRRMSMDAMDAVNQLSSDFEEKSPRKFYGSMF